MPVDAKFLLDSNILSAIIKQPHGSVSGRIAEVTPDACCTSIVVACELRYGALKKGSRRLLDKVEALLDTITVMALDTGADRRYGHLRCDLEGRGQTLGYNDLFIAAHALALGATLVTVNVREFARVPGLSVENWLTHDL